MNTTFYIEHYVTEKEVESIADLQRHFGQKNRELMKDYSGQQEIMVVIVIMKDNMKEPRAMMEVSASDFPKIPDKEIRRILKLRKYQRKEYSALEVINQTVQLQNLREAEYLKNSTRDEFRARFKAYILANIKDHLN